LLKLSDDNNAIRVICNIEDFQIDTTQKTIAEILPPNINNDDSVKDKLQSILHIFEKVLLYLSKSLIKASMKQQFNAKDFITREFQTSEDNIKNIFDMLPTRNNNTLIKSNITINNPFSYVIVTDIDNLINDQLKKYDFKKVFVNAPTQLEKKDQLKPSQLTVNEDKSTKQNFLNHKTKRAKTGDNKK
jgi:hypothetical protein